MSEQTLDEFRKAQEAEYGEYVAAEKIHIGNALAFNEGDPVPVSHVERGVVDKSQVKKVGKTPAGRPTVEKGE